MGARDPLERLAEVELLVSHQEVGDERSGARASGGAEDEHVPASVDAVTNEASALFKMRSERSTGHVLERDA